MMTNFTMVEAILLTATILMLIQYGVSVYQNIIISNANHLAISSMEDMQQYNRELFDRFIQEEKLNIAMATEIKKLRKIGTNPLSGMS